MTIIETGTATCACGQKIRGTEHYCGTRPWIQFIHEGKEIRECPKCGLELHVAGYHWKPDRKFSPLAGYVPREETQDA